MAEKPFQITLDGKLITSPDATTIGKNYQTLTNLRYAKPTNTPKGVGGMTKINNTTALANPKIRNGIHYKKEQPMESHVLVQAYDSNDANPKVYQNTTAIPNQGDFSATVLHTDTSGGGKGRFSHAPNGQVAYCNGKDSCLWGGDEMKVSKFINFNPDSSFKYDFTKQVQNSLTDSLHRATLTNVTSTGLDSNTMLLLHCDGTDGGTTFTDDSPTTPHTVTANGNAQLDTAFKKFGTASGLLDGTGDYLSIPDDADFDLSGGNFTIELWGRKGTLPPIGTYYSQGTDANNYSRFYFDGTDLKFEIYSAGSAVVSLSVSLVALPTTRWWHLAIVENGNNWYLFVFGMLKATATDTNRAANYTGSVAIGAFNDNATISDYINGWFDEVRVSNIARWIADFTPETEAYTTNDTTYLYLGSTRPLKGYKAYIGTANATSGAQTGYKWDGSDWSALTNLTDGTASGGVSFAQTGSVTFDSTESTAKVKAIDGVVLYWYRFTITSCDNATTITQITVDAPFQTIKDLWDGELRTIYSYQVFKNNTFYDFTANILEDSYDTGNDSTFVELDSLTTGQYQIVGSLERLMGISVNFLGSSVNTTANTSIAINYWNGTSWTNASTISDGTAEGAISNAKSGIITWDPPASSSEFQKENLQISGTPFTPHESTGTSQVNRLYDVLQRLVNRVRTVDTTPKVREVFPLYYYKIIFSQALSSDVQVYNITGIPAQKDIRGYKFPMFADHSLWLCGNDDNNKNVAIKSMPNAPDVLNGDNAIELAFGDETTLIAATPLYESPYELSNNAQDIKLFYKASSMFRLEGNMPENYKLSTISLTVGCPAPATLDTAIIRTEKGDTSVSIWQGANGIYISDGGTPTLISVDIANFFDKNESSTRRMNVSYADISYGKVDKEKMEYHWLFADGSSTGDLNREFVFDLITFRWFEIDRSTGKYLQCGITVTDTNGVNYMYGTIDTGYMERLENGTDFDGGNIVHTLQTGDFSPEKDYIFITTKIRNFKLTSVAKTTTSNSINVTHYGDTSTTGTAFTLSTARSGYRVIDAKKSHNLGNYVFHSFKLDMTTNDETVGFSPLFISGFYDIIREDK